VVKAVLFDVFGTLVDWRTSLTGFFETFGRERGITADWARLVDDWRESYAPTMDLVRRGELPWSNLDVLNRRSFDDLAERFGLPRLSEKDYRQCALAWHRLEPWPDVRTGLLALRRRVMTGTLSNGNVALLTDLARHGDLRFDVILSAEIFRHYKPDPEVYLGAAALLQLAPNELMLAAAHNGDLQAAATCGLRTAFLARPTEWGPHQHSDLAAGDGIELVARDVLDLAERLEGFG
jgi:2-haloacid dehalogenase